MSDKLSMVYEEALERQDSIGKKHSWLLVGSTVLFLFIMVGQSLLFWILINRLNTTYELTIQNRQVLALVDKTHISNTITLKELYIIECPLTKEFHLPLPSHCKPGGL